MWWNRRFASWMCSRQICSNYVILSCQYGPKSLRNVSNTLLNLFHEELRQFWRQKRVQPGTSKVYLVKWLVSVYIYIRGVLTFVASGLDINGCVLSYFEGTENVHCYTSCTLTTLHCSKVSFSCLVTWKDIIKYLQKCEGCTHFCEILCVYIYSA